MSRSRLPPELLDHIIDFLRDSYLTLKNCCLVSKTWIPRTRKHLFADIEFEMTDDVQSWKTMFPDPSTSPVRHAKTMFIGCPYVIEAVGKGNGRWLLAFSRVKHLTMGIPKRDPKPMTIFLVPFHGFSPILESLRMDSSALTHSHILGLVRSFPLLEDLSIDAPDRDGWGSNKKPTVTQPLNSPPFTGSLKLRTHDGMYFIASRLLSLPDGIHFQKLALTWHREEDVSSTTALVDGCRSTLKSLKIDGEFLNLLRVEPVNLSKTTKLKTMALRCWSHPGWIIETLQTVTSNHKELKWVTLQAVSRRGLNEGCEGVKDAIGETSYRGWLELDQVLAQLCESHSVQLRVAYNLHVDMDGSKERDRMEVLLPEVMARGLVDLVGRRG